MLNVVERGVCIEPSHGHDLDNPVANTHAGADNDAFHENDEQIEKIHQARPS